MLNPDKPQKFTEHESKIDFVSKKGLEFMKQTSCQHFVEETTYCPMTNSYPAIERCGRCSYYKVRTCNSDECPSISVTDGCNTIQTEIKQGPWERQVGGDHYKKFAIQPTEFIMKNKLNFLQGCVIKRVCRFNIDGGKGAEDIDKAIHELEMLKWL